MRPELTEREAIDFIQNVLKLKWARIAQKLKQPQERVEAITLIAEEFMCVVPFQTVGLLQKPIPDRRETTLEDTVKHVMEGHGGSCITLNGFFKLLIDALGLPSFFVRCSIHGPVKGHLAVAIPNFVTEGDLWLVDVGCGYVTPRPVCLSFDGEDSPVYEYGFLKMRFTRRNVMTGELDTTGKRLWRLHHADSTFLPREVRGAREDGFNHVFWEMETLPAPFEYCPLHADDVDPILSFRKIRACLVHRVEGERDLMMSYIRAERRKSDGSLSAEIVEEFSVEGEEGRNGERGSGRRRKVVVTPIDRKRLVEELTKKFPCALTKSVVEAALSNMMMPSDKRNFAEAFAVNSKT